MKVELMQTIKINNYYILSKTVVLFSLSVVQNFCLSVKKKTCCYVLEIEFLLLCFSAGQQCGGGPGPAGDWDPQLCPQTASPAGHTAFAQGQYCT